MPLSLDQIDAAARLLTDARMDGQLLDSLGDLEPKGVACAYAIAEAHAKLLDTAPVGWKIGCTSQKAMDILNSPGPFAGRIFDGTVYGPAIEGLPAPSPGLECEFAFHLGSDLSPRNAPHTVSDVRGATEAVAPAIELVAPRFRDFTGVGYLSLIADSGANAGVVLGKPVAVDDCPDLQDVAVELEIDGDQASSGAGSAILGDPWNALVWLANHLCERGIGLQAGEFVLSGTCTGINPLSPGSSAVAHYGAFGQVRAVNTAAC